MNTCPADEALLEYLEDKLASDAIIILELHVQACGTCQGRMQRLSGDEQTDHWRELLNRTVTASALDSKPSGPTEDAPARSIDGVDRGRFHALRVLGEGGQGKVYAALDDELNRDVALKVSKSRHAGASEAWARFLAEAEITGKLEHPGIAPVYGLGVGSDGKPFYATRLIEGSILAAEIKRFHELPRDAAEDRSLALRKLLTAFLSVCNTIAYAHSRGVLHRDLKPANIMLGRYGETFVLDWGLAKLMGASDQDGNAPSRETLSVSPPREALQTLAGDLFGTPRYMSPEQASGQPGAIGLSSDIYSLGATLYCILTGAPPVSPSEQAGTGDDTPLRPRQVNEVIDPALEAICLKAMAAKPQDRYVSPTALAQDIERWLADEPLQVYAEPFRRRTERWIRKHRMGVSISLSLVVLVGTVAGAGILVEGAFSRAEDARQTAAQLKTLKEEAEASAADAKAQKNEADRQRLRADGLLYASNMNMAHVAWQDRRIALSLDLLERHRSHGAGDIDHRGFEWYYLWGLLHQRHITLQGHADFVTSVAFSPAGDLLASGSFDKSVVLWDAKTGAQVRKLPGHLGAVRGVAFSPARGILATSSDDRTIKIWDQDSGKNIRTLAGHTDGIHRIAFNHDGSRLASGSNDGTIRVWDMVGDELPVIIHVHAAVLAVCFSPDGQRLASGGHDHEPRIWDWAKRQELVRFKKHVGFVHAVCFSPDGSRLATGSRDGQAIIWDATDGKALWTLREHTNTVTNLRFSPDGALLVSTGVDQTIKIWNVASGAKQMELRGHTGMIWGLSFHSDGRHLATGSDDHTIKIWDLLAPEGQTALSAIGKSSITDCCFVGEDQFASGGADGIVRLWDARRKKQLRVLGTHPRAFLVKLARSKDGNFLASGADDGTLRLWNLKNGQEIASWSTPKLVHTCIALDPGGKRLAAGSTDQNIRVWDVEKRQSHSKINAHQATVRCLEYSHDGRLLASGSDDVIVKIWDAENGHLVQSLHSHTHPVYCVKFSPDDRFLASAGDDQIVRIWDCSTWTTVATLKGHTNRIWSLAFSPDGSRLVSSCQDGLLKVWDVRTEHELLTIKTGSSAVNTVGFSPDGARLVSGASNGLIDLWQGSSNTDITKEVR